MTLVGQAHNSGSTASLVVSYSSSAGNTLIATGRGFAGGAALYPAISDSAGNTWHYSAVTAHNPPAAPLPEGVAGTFIAWTFQDVGPVTSVTIGMGGAAFMEVNVSEWSAIASEATGDYAQHATGEITSPALPVANGSLAVGFAYNDSGGNYASPPAGATALALSGEVNAAVYEFFASSGSLGWDWGATGTYGEATVVAAVFTGTGSAPVQAKSAATVTPAATGSPAVAPLATAVPVVAPFASSSTVVS